MSNEALNWAWKQDVQAVSAAKFVLIVLADFANDEWLCFPSQDRIADMTGLSSRTVRTHLAALETAGLIRREARWRDGSRTTDNVWLIPEDSSGRGSHTGKPRQFIPETVSGYPLVEPSDKDMDSVPLVDASPVLDGSRPAPRSTPSKLLDEEFQTFWGRYPRRVAVGRAREAYRKARKEATLVEILAGLDRYLRTKPEYADWAHAASWLNAERWKDETSSRPVGPSRVIPVSAPVPDVDPDDVEAWIAAMEAGRRG